VRVKALHTPPPDGSAARQRAVEPEQSRGKLCWGRWDGRGACDVRECTVRTFHFIGRVFRNEKTGTLTARKYRLPETMASWGFPARWCPQLACFISLQQYWTHAAK